MKWRKSLRKEAKTERSKDVWEFESKLLRSFIKIKSHNLKKNTENYALWYNIITISFFSHTVDNFTIWAQSAIIKYHRLGGLSNINLFPQISKGYQSKIKMLIWSGCGEIPFLGLPTVDFLLCAHMAEDKKQTLLCLFL